MAGPGVSADPGGRVGAARLWRQAAGAMTINRRKFMTAVGGTAATAAVAGIGGELLLKKSFPVRKPVASQPVASPPVKITPPKIVKAKPLPAENLLNIPGLSPFY